MTYETSWPPTVTVRELVRELARHSVTLDEFHVDFPPLPVYRSVDVLEWLGY